MAPHPAKQRERLAFQRVAGSNDGDRGRIALEVGSVLLLRSTASIGRSSIICSDDGSVIDECSAW